VTGQTSREDELGDGKWTEPARSLDDVRRQMDAIPVREMDLAGGGPPWAVLAVLAVVAMVGIAWFMFRPPERTTVAPTGRGLPAATEASVTAPQVQVVTVPPRGRVLLDGRTYGRAPTVVPVPSDSGGHELCVEFDDPSARTCRTLTGAALALEDPYVVDTTK